jgi:hypothetical protein
MRRAAARAKPTKLIARVMRWLRRKISVMLETSERIARTPASCAEKSFSGMRLAA